MKKGKGRQAKYEQSLPSVTESPIFKDRETMDKVMKEAMKLDYNSLIEFSSSEVMTKALLAFVNGETTPVIPKRAEATPSQDPPPDPEFAGGGSAAPETGKEKDEIDEILDEFTY